MYHPLPDSLGSSYCRTAKSNYSLIFLCLAPVLMLLQTDQLVSALLEIETGGAR